MECVAVLENLNVAEALKNLEEEIARNPLNLSLWHQVATLSSKFPEEAIGFYEDVLEKDPESKNARNCIQDCLCSMAWKRYCKEEYGDMLLVSEKILDNFPNSSCGWDYAGMALIELKEPAVAVHCHNLAIEKENGHHSNTYNCLARAYNMMGLPEKALEVYERMEEIFQGYQNLNNWGNTYCDTGEFEKAIETYNKGLESDPSDKLLRNNKAVALIGLYKKTGKQEYLNEALNIFSDLGIETSYNPNPDSSILE